MIAKFYQINICVNLHPFILTDICVKLQENYHHGQKLHSLLLKRVYATNCQLHVSEKWRQDHATIYTLPNLCHPVIIYFWLVQKTLWQDNLRIWQINFTFLKVAIIIKKLIGRRWCLLEGHLCRIVRNHNNKPNRWVDFQIFMLSCQIFVLSFMMTGSWQLLANLRR